MKKFISHYFIGFFLFSFIFLNTAIDSISNDTLKTPKNLISPNYKIREKAVKRYLSSKNEKDFEILRMYLPEESNASIAHLIIQAMAQKPNKKDFFSLLDYLKLQNDENNAIEVFSVLHQIHSGRLMKEFKILLKEKKQKDIALLFLAYLKAIKEPSENQIDFIKKTMTQKNLLEKFMRDRALMQNKKETEFLQALKPYAKDDKKFFSSKTPIPSLYWYLAYQKVHFPDRKNLSDDFSIGIKKPIFTMKALSRYGATRQQRLMNILLEYNILTEDSIAENNIVLNPSAKRTILSFGIRNGGFDKLTKKIIEEARSAIVIFFIANSASFVKNTAVKSLAITCTRNSKLNATACFRLLLASENSKAFLYFFSKPIKKQEPMLAQNLGLLLGKKSFMLKNWPDKRARLLDKIFLTMNQTNKLKAIMHLSPYLLKEEFVRLSSYLLTDKSRILTLAMAARLQELGKTAALYTEIIPGFDAYFRMPRKVF